VSLPSVIMLPVLDFIVKVEPSGVRQFAKQVACLPPPSNGISADSVFSLPIEERPFWTLANENVEQCLLADQGRL